jgi:farnesyl-diphosphate farnesyltransferase
MIAYRSPADRSLDQLLERVSRSFYLSLAVLPRALRQPLSVSYLVARAADTIADTRLLAREHRLKLLLGLRSVIDDPARLIPYIEALRTEVGVTNVKQDAERLLLQRLDECLSALFRLEAGDLDRSRNVLRVLVRGMERDLGRFAEDGELAALETAADLDEYCYLAAGCVGEYWTLMMAAHVPSLERLRRPDWVERGVRLGKALQMVNVIRDVRRDLDFGRCYWPRERLTAHDLSPEALRSPEDSYLARPVLNELRAITLAHIDAAFPYVLAIPKTAPRLRLAALWPLWIALATVSALRDAPKLLAPNSLVKISRREVYGILAQSIAVVASDRLLEKSHARFRRLAE